MWLRLLQRLLRRREEEVASPGITVYTWAIVRVSEGRRCKGLCIALVPVAVLAFQSFVLLNLVWEPFESPCTKQDDCSGNYPGTACKFNGFEALCEDCSYFRDVDAVLNGTGFEHFKEKFHLPEHLSEGDCKGGEYAGLHFDVWLLQERDVRWWAQRSSHFGGSTTRGNFSDSGALGWLPEFQESGEPPLSQQIVRHMCDIWTECLKDTLLGQCDFILLNVKGQSTQYKAAFVTMALLVGVAVFDDSREAIYEEKLLRRSMVRAEPSDALSIFADSLLSLSLRARQVALSLMTCLAAGAGQLASRPTVSGCVLNMLSLTFVLELDDLAGVLLPKSVLDELEEKLANGQHQCQVVWLCELRCRLAIYFIAMIVVGTNFSIVMNALDAEWNRCPDIIDIITDLSLSLGFVTIPCVALLQFCLRGYCDQGGFHDTAENHDENAPRARGNPLEQAATYTVLQRRCGVACEWVAEMCFTAIALAFFDFINDPFYVITEFLVDGALFYPEFSPVFYIMWAYLIFRPLWYCISARLRHAAASAGPEQVNDQALEIVGQGYANPQVLGNPSTPRGSVSSAL